MGLLFYNKGEQKLAIEYYKKSVIVSEDIGNKKAISASLNFIGIVYSEIGNYK